MQVDDRDPSPTDIKDLRMVSAANFIAAALMVPWGILVALLAAAGAKATWGTRDELGAQAATLLGAVGLILLWVAAILHLVVGRCVRRRKGHRLAVVASAIAALNPTCVPVGLGVGVLTWYVLRRPSVRAVFDGHDA